ncbi:MAG: methyltransferase family protein [Candidatus Acidiferrales bacterium]
MNLKAIVGLVVQTLLAFGIALAGWGFDDLRGFLAHPARAGLLVVGLATLAWVLASRLDVQIFRRGARPVGWQRFGLLLLILFGILLIFYLPYADRRSLLVFSGADFLRYVGLGLYTVGNIVAFLAVRTLGRQYSGYVTLQEGHRLVTDGIYGVIRHPIYLRLLLVSLGLPLVFRSRLCLPLLILGALFAGYRISREEKLLAESFGEPYLAYRKRTRGIIPFVY